MINLPVEPVIFQRVDLLQLFSGERAANRLAGEVPGCPGLEVCKLDRRRLGFNEKFERTPVNPTLKGADRFVVIAEHDEQGSRVPGATYAVEDQPLLFQGKQRVRNVLAIDRQSRYKRARR